MSMAANASVPIAPTSATAAVAAKMFFCRSAAKRRACAESTDAARAAHSVASSCDSVWEATNSSRNAASRRRNVSTAAASHMPASRSLESSRESCSQCSCNSCATRRSSAWKADPRPEGEINEESPLPADASKAKPSTPHIDVCPLGHACRASSLTMAPVAAKVSAARASASSARRRSAPNRKSAASSIELLAIVRSSAKLASKLEQYSLMSLKAFVASSSVATAFPKRSRKESLAAKRSSIRASANFASADA
mmetsp:Transcript_37068/g.107006  ORF Transcript_37068/g.107006 Transcript_37068/m.107006 type:complete len:253 (-) Transcript_37068:906-1664(-)